MAIYSVFFSILAHSGMAVEVISSFPFDFTRYGRKLTPLNLIASQQKFVQHFYQVGFFFRKAFYVFTLLSLPLNIVLIESNQGNISEFS